MSEWSRVRVRCALALFLLFVLVAPTSPGYAGPAGPTDQSALDKIAPWVLEHTAGGAQAELLVVLADQADLGGAETLPGKLEKGRYVYRTLWDKAQSTQEPLLKWLEANKIEHRSYYIVNLIWVRGSRDVALALASRPDVARIEGNPRLWNFIPQPLPAPAGPASPASLTGIEANITYVQADQVWAMGFTGQGIVVGGQDTGYDWDHLALKSHYRGWNGSTADHDYNWHDSIHTGGGVCGADSLEPCDDYGHGTHTMGTLVGDDGNSNQIGMAPGAKWIGCRNMDVGVGTSATYLECFEFFLAPYPVGGTPADGDPDRAPDVTNNSWTCPPSEGCSWDVLQEAVEAQRAAGIMTVVSAGNAGPGCSSVSTPPAIYAASYTVGALDGTQGYAIAALSSRGPVTIDGSNRRKPDITAPGVFIRSSLRGGSYGTMSGTSMAGPHVAGAVALLWSARPALKNQIAPTEQIFNTSAVHVASNECSSDGWPNNVYGYGRLDVKAAVDLAPVSIIWTGVSSADWHTAGNWNPARVPTYTDDVIVPGSLPIATAWPVVADAAGCNDLTLQPGAQLTMTSKATLAVQGVVSNSGRLSQSRPVNLATGPVEFMGLYNNLGDDRYLGLVISPTGDMGDVWVSSRGNQACGTTGTLTQTVQRCYDITPEISRTAVITFYYWPIEANGNLIPTVYHWDRAGYRWEAMTPTLAGGNGQVMWAQAPVSDYSPFSLKDPDKPGAGGAPVAITLRALAAPGGAPVGLPVAGLLILGLAGVARRIVSRR